MKLELFLEKSDLSESQFAKMIGVHRNTIYKYTKGERRPEEEIMLLIAQVTGGLVTPNDFYDLPPLAAAQPHAEA